MNAASISERIELERGSESGANGWRLVATATLAPPHPLDCIRRELSETERILHDEAVSEVALAHEIGDYVHESGGKRLRPSLVILACRAAGSSSMDPLRAGAAVEMIHAATLLHDDVVDGAESRRGRPTVSARWGDRQAVIVGNLMLSRAFGLLVRWNLLEELRILSGCMMTMCRGEIMQNLYRGDFEMSEERYYAVIRSKTADFLSASCRIGARIAGADREAEDRLADYGMNLGLAFQVTDDLLDVCGEEEKIGKPLGGDLREGKMTLPLILGLKSATETERARVKAIFKKPIIDAKDLKVIREILIAYDAPKRSRQISERFIEESLERLSGLPESPARFALEYLATVLPTRSK